MDEASEKAGSTLVRGRGGEPGRQALVIAGMHRSGTSALARMLTDLGVDGPRTALPSGKGGEVHWGESAPIVDLHEELMASAGRAWHDVLPFPSAWHESPAAAEYRERMAGLVAEEYAGSSMLLVKDPRICRLIPFWLAVLDEVDIRPAFALPVRNPLEVAASLARREDFSVPKGLLLWLRYVLDAERETRGRARAFIDYADLLVDWRAVAGEISRGTGLEWPNSGDAASADIDSFISASHRRNSFTPEELTGRGDVASWVTDAHDSLLDACRSGGEPDRRVLDRIGAALAEADLAYGPLVAELGDQLVDLRRRRQQAEKRARAAKRRLGRAEEELERKREVERRGRGLEKRLAALEEDMAAVTGSLSWRLTRPLRFAKSLVTRRSAGS